MSVTDSVRPMPYSGMGQMKIVYVSYSGMGQVKILYVPYSGMGQVNTSLCYTVHVSINSNFFSQKTVPTPLR